MTTATAYLVKEHDFGDRWVYGIAIEQGNDNEKWLPLREATADDDPPTTHEVSEALTAKGWGILHDHGPEADGSYFRRYKVRSERTPA